MKEQKGIAIRLDVEEFTALDDARHAHRESWQRLIPRLLREELLHSRSVAQFPTRSATLAPEHAEAHAQLEEVLSKATPEQASAVRVMLANAHASLPRARRTRGA